MANWHDITMKAEEIADSNSKKYIIEDGEYYCYSYLECKNSALDMAVWLEDNIRNTAPKKEELAKEIIIAAKKSVLEMKDKLIREISSTEVISSKEIVDEAFRLANDGVEVADVPSQRLDAAIKMAIWMQEKFKESELK